MHALNAQYTRYKNFEEPFRINWIRVSTYEEMYVGDKSYNIAPMTHGRESKFTVLFSRNVGLGDYHTHLWISDSIFIQRTIEMEPKIMELKVCFWKMRWGSKLSSFSRTIHKFVRGISNARMTHCCGKAHGNEFKLSSSKNCV